MGEESRRSRPPDRNLPRKQRKSKGRPLLQAAADDASSRDEQTKRSRRGRAIGMTVATRRQTTQEQRRFEGALELLLTEMVRQAIARGGTDIE